MLRERYLEYHCFVGWGTILAPSAVFTLGLEPV